jgi:putative endonuclease
MFWVYALYNKKYNKIYIGQTDSLIKRVKEHNSRVLKRSYTARFDGEWQLIFKEKLISRYRAVEREKKLKSYQGRQFIKRLIKSVGV